MDSVLRAAAVYLMLLVLFRLAGKRALAQITTFDLVLLLIVSESIQNALVADDESITNAAIVVITLLGTDLGLAVLTRRYPLLDKLVDDVPLVLVANGKAMHERLRRARVSESDILDAARQTRGLTEMEQIGYAILERTGGISVIPRTGDDRATRSGGASPPSAI